MYRARYIVSDQFIQKPIFLPSSNLAHNWMLTPQLWPLKLGAGIQKKKKKVKHKIFKHVLQLCKHRSPFVI